MRMLECMLIISLVGLGCQFESLSCDSIKRNRLTTQEFNETTSYFLLLIGIRLVAKAPLHAKVAKSNATCREKGENPCSKAGLDPQYDKA